MKNGQALLRAGAILMAVSCGAARAAAPPAPATQPQPATMLGTFGSWRMFHVLAPPQIAQEAGAKPIVFEQYWLNQPSAPPPKGWTQADFDDSEWLRGPAPMACKTPFVARACFRGRFTLADPARAGKLTLTMDYQGGVIVYVNGQEVRRSHVPPGDPSPLSEPYPPEAFLGEDGVPLASGGRSSPEVLRRMALRKRTLADVEVPAALLRKGLNLLAVEVVRSPYDAALAEKKDRGARTSLYNLPWNTCELLALRLVSAGGEGWAGGLSRLAGFQVWNADILRADVDLDFGDRCEPLGPVTIQGVRNGAFSAKVVVGSTQPIRGLRASVTDLKGPGGTIPSSAVQLRYGAPGGAEYGLYSHLYGFGSAQARSPRSAGTLDVLEDSPPKEAPVREAGAKRADGLPAAPGAVVPIWVTTQIPAGARPGLYEGMLTVQAQDQKPVQTPLRVTVLDWALPDPHDLRTWIELIQSPDTLQLEYGVEPWSDRHFDLIARSMRLIREVGSGILYLPLICGTNYGNEESIVRWVRKPHDKSAPGEIRRGELGAGDANQYDFDFTVLDRYLDTTEKNLGKPKLVCFLTWDVYLVPKGNLHQVTAGIDRVADRWTEPVVSLLDPATGKLSQLRFPKYEADAAAKGNWQRLFAALRERMKKRGLEDAMMIGWSSDVKPRKEEIAFWGEVTGGLRWVSHSHAAPGAPGTKGVFGYDTHFQTGYMTSVYSLAFLDDPAKGRLYGWKNPVLHAQNIRYPGLDNVPTTFVRCLGEINIAGSQRGFGRLGGDTWSAVRDKSGRRAGRAWERFPQSNWSNLNLRCSLLAPGPEGALATARFENLREGLQECEARIFLEQALTTPSRRAKLAPDLQAHAQAALDERSLAAQRGVANFEVGGGSWNALRSPWNWTWQEGVNGHAWFQSSGWRQRSSSLYTLAAEAAKALGGG